LAGEGSIFERGLALPLAAHSPFYLWDVLEGRQPLFLFFPLSYEERGTKGVR